MSRVAIATCAGHHVDPDGPILVAALADVGVEAEEMVWDDPDVSFNEYDLVVVRSTWDYASRRVDFLEWARGVRRLENPFAVIEYSSDKHYLDDLAARGQRVVATSFVDVGVEPVFPDGDFVVKPAVGAGSIDAERYARDDGARARDHVARLHERGRDVIIQPYVDSVDAVGELAVVVIDGSFSHAMVKGAMLNVPASARDALYRREQMSRAAPEPEAVAFAAAVLSSLSFSDLLYARVDLVAVDEGWAITELELVEPSLFLAYDELAAPRLARAIERRLSSTRSSHSP